MKKKIIATILSIIGILFVGISILYFLDFFVPQEAGILIESDPVSTVYIDGKEVGKTPFETNLPPKEVLIKVKPENLNETSIDDYETKVNLISGIKTIIIKTFRKNEDYSSGVIVSFEKMTSKDSYVTVVSVPDNAQVLIDNKVYGYTPIRVSIPGGDHNLVVTSDNYLKKQLPIRVYKGYKLTAFVKLARLDEPEQVQVEQVSEVLFRIKVNEVDTDFLRVREGASVGFPEVGQVKPDEEFDVIETGENDTWYKILLPDDEGQPAGRQGWVSADFVTKITP